MTHVRGPRGEAVLCELEGNQEAGTKKLRRHLCPDPSHPGTWPDSGFSETGEKFHKMSDFPFLKQKSGSVRMN